MKSSNQEQYSEKSKSRQQMEKLAGYQNCIPETSEEQSPSYWYCMVLLFYCEYGQWGSKSRGSHGYKNRRQNGWDTVHFKYSLF